MVHNLFLLIKVKYFADCGADKGLIQGLEVEGRPIGEIVNRGLEEGLIIITAGSNVLRFVPPLVVTEADVDEMIAKLEKCF